MSIIKVTALNFAYQKKQPILQGLDLNVPKGSIYGFLGANGAGKSTTIRNILGLLQPKSGQIHLFGNHLQKNKLATFRRIGALIESPSLYPHLHAYDHLKIASKYHTFSTKKIATILDKVNLTKHGKKAVKHYSTGMKQRLGLAMALAHDPELLLLDEPTNGLDPSGISEIRQIIQQLRAEGKTILLSSHILSEIEKIATHVGIIQQGKTLFEGTLEELSALKSQNAIIEIRGTNWANATSIIDKYKVISQKENYLHLQVQRQSELPDLVRQLVQAGVDIYEIKQLKSDLETQFMSMTTA